MVRSARRPSRGRVRHAGGVPGFTLIELLVVVAIIAIMIAILLPAMARVRWQSKAVACAANLHDLGIACNGYAMSYAGFFPLTPKPGTDTLYALWEARLLPNVNVLICPATRNIIRSETLRNPIQSYYSSPDDPSLRIAYRNSDIDRCARGPADAAGGHSYEYNGCYNEYPSDAGKSHPLEKKHKEMRHFRFAPNEMLLAHDEDNEFMGSARGCEGSLFGENNCPQSWDNHGEKGLNTMFADGHAQWTQKRPGTYEDVRYKRQKPPRLKSSKNASIDRLWLKSQYPWEFHR